MEKNDMNQLEVKYGLPREVVFCKKCTISNQRPSSVVEFKHKQADKKPTIGFNEQGICSACQYAEIKKTKIDWKLREKELRELCDKHRSKDGSYDCIVPGSGGKDSMFVSHILKHKYGMNPLTVTWAPHIYTEIGWVNFQNWIHAGFDNILNTPNGKVHRLLTKLAFENLVHPFQPFIIGQRMTGPRFSALYKIPLVFYGENAVEYGNNIEDANKPTMDTQFFLEEPDIGKLFLGGVSGRQLTEDYGVDFRDLQPYMPVNCNLSRHVNMEVHYFSYYVNWDPQENFYYASEHVGFQSNVERTEGSFSKYSSIDDRIDPLHYYTTMIKFGIGRATYDTSQEIRNGKINREEGVALVRKYDAEFPGKYFNEILKYMDITEERFWEIIDNARSPHLWKKTNGEWRLRHQVE